MYSIAVHDDDGRASGAPPPLPPPQPAAMNASGDDEETGEEYPFVLELQAPPPSWGDHAPGPAGQVHVAWRESRRRRLTCVAADGAASRVRRRRLYDSSHQPKWRNWQTRRTQNPLPARACGFEPHLRHRSTRPLPVSPRHSADRDPHRRRRRARAQPVHQGGRQPGRARRARGRRAPPRLGRAAPARPRRPRVRRGVVPAAHTRHGADDRPHRRHVPAHLAHEPEPGTARRGSRASRHRARTATARSTSRITRSASSRRSGSTC